MTDTEPVDPPDLVERTPDGLILTVTGEAGTERLARSLAAVVTPDTVIGLVGPLGSGKTRLVRALAEALDVPPEAISSPTFVLIHEYEGSLPVYHFDTYRLGSPLAFDALGPADYWHSGGLCLIEWADRVADRLPEDSWWLQIEPLGPSARRFRLRFPSDQQEAAGRLLALLSDPGTI